MEQTSIGKYKLICFTSRGREVMERIRRGLLQVQERDGRQGVNLSGQDDTCKRESVTNIDYPGNISDWTGRYFVTGNTLIFIGACGIAVRAIAPFVRDKATDPAVLVVDENAGYVIPILSGHLGGAVKEAKIIADIIEAEAVITTATDVRGEFAVDVFAKENGLIIGDMKKAREFTARLLEKGSGSCFIDDEFKDVISCMEMPENISVSKETHDIYISPATYDGMALQLIPRCVVIGMGCRRGKSSKELISYAKKCLYGLGIDPRAVRAVVSADIKADEQGLIETARAFGAEFVTFGGDELSAQQGEFSGSDFVKEKVGVDNVCERSVMAFGCCRLIQRKVAESGMTFAAGIAAMELTWG